MTDRARQMSEVSLPDAPAARRPEPRRRVLDAAIECFSQHGFHGTSMQQICAAAGMSPGALYRYFPSKDAMIVAIVEEERSARAGLLACLDAAPGFIAGLVAMGEALFSGKLPMACIDLAPEILAESARNPALKEVFDAAEAEMTSAIRNAFIKAQERGELDRSLDPEIALLMINVIGDGLVTRNKLDPNLSLTAMMPAMGDMLARMFAPRGPVADQASPSQLLDAH